MLQVGVHTVPCGIGFVHPFCVSNAPFNGAVAVHGFGLHVPTLKIPFVQLVAAGWSYPAGHVGWHDAPDARVGEHVPMAPSAGALTEVQSGSQVTADSFPPTPHVDVAGAAV